MAARRSALALLVAWTLAELAEDAAILHDTHLLELRVHLTLDARQAKRRAAVVATRRAVDAAEVAELRAHLRNVRTAAQQPRVLVERVHDIAAGETGTAAHEAAALAVVEAAAEARLPVAHRGQVEHCCHARRHLRRRRADSSVLVLVHRNSVQASL
jgi:hypothetical protein